MAMETSKHYNGLHDFTRYGHNRKQHLSKHANARKCFYLALNNGENDYFQDHHLGGNMGK